jgi:fructose-bisphosphate aldolase class I
MTVTEPRQATELRPATEPVDAVGTADVATPVGATGLVVTARALVAGDKGLLAMDESTRTCSERFATAGITQSEEVRRDYRELLVRTPGLGDCISGAILYDETIRQHTRDGVPFAQAVTDAGIIPGIKVDIGEFPLAAHPGEQVTEGLDGLADRLSEYYKMGARFAKWRAVFDIGDATPSAGCMNANAAGLARYAAACQEAGLVPVVEPEVLMAGDHTLERCETVTEAVLRAVFTHLVDQRVVLEAMILKPNMVLPGSACPTQNGVDAVAGVAFLSGGQPGELASARLNAINQRAASAPWALAFSFARAIQHPALEIWGGHKKQITAAQDALYHRARCNQAARRGEYQPEMEETKRS